MKRSIFCACASALVLLSACGGSSDPVVEAPPAAADNTVPASATATPLAFSQYSGSLTSDDRAEPLDIEQVQPPASETEEPIDVV